MRITVPFAIFASAFKLAANATDRRATFPIIGQVHIRAFADANLAELTGTDNESRLSIQLAEAVVEAGGEAMLEPVAVKAALAAGKGADSVTIESSSKGAKIKVGGQSFGAGDLDAQDFPSWIDRAPEVGAIRCETALLAFGLKTTLFAVSTDDGRPNLTGVFFEAAGERLTMVSTDGHRMAKTAFPAAVSTHEERLSVIVPKTGVELIQDIVTGFGTEISVFGDHIRIVTPALGARGQVTLRVRLIDAPFPDYTRVIPSPDSAKTITVAAADLCEAVDVICKTEISLAKQNRQKAAMVVAETEGQSGFKLYGSTVAYLSPDDFQLAVISCDKGRAGAFKAGYNATYWPDLCKVLEEPRYSLQLIDALSPTVIRPFDEPVDLDTLFVIMPMRL